MDHNTNDMLFPLMLLGDYLRGHYVPVSGHPLLGKLELNLPNGKILALHIGETHQRLENMAAAYRKEQGSRIVHQPLEHHRTVLPQYCRLHSVVHGLSAWASLHPNIFSSESRERLEQIRRLDKAVLRLFGEYGLNLEIANEILVMSGRGLVNIDMDCFSRILPRSGLLSPPSDEQLPDSQQHYLKN
jgi:hypothetical protein